MQSRYLLGLCLIIALNSCKEKGPAVDLGVTKRSDTTYMSVVETQQLKNVLIEEFTGVSCPPCPGGHEIVKQIKGQHPGKVIVMAYHIFNFPQAEPVKDLTKNDLRTQDATDIGNTIFGGVGNIPVAGVDRQPLNNDIILDRGLWANTAKEQVGKKTPLNLDLSASYDEVTREVTLRAKVAFTETVSRKVSLNVAVIEDSIIDAQKNQLKTDTFYVHNYVLRDLVTPVGGNAFLDNMNVKEAGRVYERTLKFTIDEKWSADKCKIVAFITGNDAVEKEVIQSAIAEVKK